MPVKKTRRNVQPKPDAELVTVNLGNNKFKSDLVIARLQAEGIEVGYWDGGVKGVSGMSGGFAGFTGAALVRPEDLDAVEVAMRDGDLL